MMSVFDKLVFSTGSSDCHRLRDKQSDYKCRNSWMGP